MSPFGLAYPLRILSVFLLLFCNRASVSAQYFEKTYGTNPNNTGAYFSTTSNGGVVIAGNTTDSTLLRTGYLMLHVDQFGNETWRKSIVNAFNATANAVITLSDASIALLGTHTGVVYQNVAEVMLFDSIGNLLNLRVYPPFNGWGTSGVALANNNDTAVSLTLFNDGFISNNYYSIYNLRSDLTTSWNDFAGYDGSYTTPHGLASDSVADSYTLAYYDNYFYSTQALFQVTNIRKHNLTGSLLLDSLYEFQCITTGLSTTKDGGAIIMGIEDLAVQRDIVIIRIDQAGNVLWKKQHGSYLDEEPVSIVETSDNGYALLVTIADTILQGQHDLLLMKFDSSGDSLWSHQFGGNLNDIAMHIDQYGSDLLLLGSSNSFGSDHIYLIRTDSLGIVRTDYKVEASGRYFCQGDSAILQILPVPDSSMRIVWSTADTTNSIHVTNSGGYSAFLVDTLGDTIQTPITSVYFTRLPNADFGPDTMGLCTGQQLIDTAHSEITNSYQWYLDGSLLTGENSYFITPQQTGNYSLVVSNLCARDSVNSFVDTLYPLPTQPVVTAPAVTFVCPGDSLHLSATPNPNVSYQWNSIGDFNTTPIPGAVDSFYYAKVNGFYSVQITNLNGCSSASAAFPVFFDNDQVSITPSGPTSFCEGGEIRLMAGPGSDYLWSRGDTIQTITVRTTNQFFVSYIDAYGCPKTSDTITITVFSNPIVDLGPDTTICQNESMLLSAGAGYNSYLWNNMHVDSTFLATSAGPFPDTEVYYVRVTDSNNCKGRDTIKIIFDVCLGVGFLNYDMCGFYPGIISPEIPLKLTGPENKKVTVILTDIQGRIIYSGNIFLPAELYLPKEQASSIVFLGVMEEGQVLISGKVLFMR